MAATALVLGTGVAEADTSGKKIALSNNYAGNSWRQSMLKSWDKVTKKAVADGVVAEATPFTTSENQVTEQAAQIQNLILQGYDAIVIDAASPTAVNGAVKEACDAGIVVVSFDGIVTEPCAWRIAIDFEGMGKAQMDYLATRMKGGKLLEIRGLAGVFVDDEIHKGIEAGVKAHPGFTIAGSVHGDWTQTVAQREVAGILPTLPEIDAVVTQGGDGYGAAQAVPGPIFTFAAYLGAVGGPAPNGIAGAALCLVAIFLPGLLLVAGALPFWDALRRRPAAQAAMPRDQRRRRRPARRRARTIRSGPAPSLGPRDFALAPGRLRPARRLARAVLARRRGARGGRRRPGGAFSPRPEGRPSA